MIKLCKGDLLKSDCDIICHQVNLLGIFGGGLAKQVADLYPECEQECKEFIKYINKKEKDLLGLYHLFQIKTNCDKFQLIASCFSQNERFETCYRALENIVLTIRDFARIVSLKTIGIPKNYGCGIAKGDWNKVRKIWVDAFKDSTIELQIWELEKYV